MHLVNFLDGLAIAYVAFAAWRGRANGVAKEGFRLIRVALAFGAGVGLYGLIRDILTRALSLGVDVTGPVGFLAVMVGTWYAVRGLRDIIQAWLSARFSSHSPIAGAIAGGIRALVIVISIVGVTALAGRTDTPDRSLVGRVASRAIR